MEFRYNALVIEDEESIARLVDDVLSDNGFHVLKTTSGRDGLILAESDMWDILIMDLGLPDMDGIEIIKTVRRWSNIPIVVISARMQEAEKIKAFDEGADDYLTKPFGTGEFLARIKTAIRHGDNLEPEYEGVYRARDLLIDFDKREVSVRGKIVHLTKNEYNMISVLARAAGRVMSYENIMKAVWGPNLLGDNRILRVNMTNIRKKIEQNPSKPEYLLTEAGIGYRMLENEA